MDSAQTDDTENPEKALNFLAFSVGRTDCAVSLASVTEVVRAVQVSDLPGAPDTVEGVINYRGTIAPVFNIRHRFRSPGQPAGPNSHMVIVTFGTRYAALSVDRAKAITAIPGDSIDYPRESLSDDAPLAGVARTTDGLIVIHDVEKFLSSEDTLALDQALEAKGANGD